VVWSEVVSATTVYRWNDVVSQTGLPAFLVYNVGYFGAQIVGVSVAHGAENPGAGAGAGFGVYILFSAVAVFISSTPEYRAARFWGSNPFLSRFWYLAFYSGNQLRRDLNIIVGSGKNWKIPTFLPVLLRYVSGPILAIVLSFAYPEFHRLRYDPLMILGFIVANIGMVIILAGFIMPRYYGLFLPPHRRDEGSEPTIPNEPKGQVVARAIENPDIDGGESGSKTSDSDEKRFGTEEVSPEMKDVR
jgi:solute carrier family 6 (neurotransmitter transporter, GABA) member 1